jgi:haloalkane dehalogenase
LIHVQESIPLATALDQTLVFINITSFGSVLLGAVLPALAALGYRALAVDMMGYGRSDKRSGPTWFIETWADNMEQAFDQLGIAPDGLICGHFAGLLGVELALRKRPGMQALVLEGMPLIPPETRTASLAAGTPPPIIWDEAGTHAIEYWKVAYKLMKILDPGIELGVPNQKVREAYISYQETRCFEPSTMEAAASYAIEQKMAQIRLPTLVMCSDTDWNLKSHDQVVASIPTSREHRFQGIHPLHEFSRPDRASEYVAQLQGFFADVLGQ